MVKNSYILPLFGIGLILSTSTLFPLLDSSIPTNNSQIFNGNEEGTLEVKDDVVLEGKEEEKEETVDEVTKEEESLSEDSTIDPEEATKDDTPSEAKEVTPPETPKETTNEEIGEETKTETNEKSPEAQISTPEHSPEPFVVAPETPQTAKSKSPEPQASPSSNTSSSKPSNTPKKQVKKTITPRKYSRDYKSISLTQNSGVYRIIDQEQKEHFLYSPTDKLSFALPSDQQNYQKVSKDNIKISIFKQSAWKNTSRNVDEYEDLSKDQISELFKDREDNKEQTKRLKQILMSLSNRRDWKFHVDGGNYKSQVETPVLIGVDGNNNNKKNNKTGMELKIKYFDKFEELKDYINQKMEICSEEKSGPCIAKEEELMIIDQDKMTIFENAKKESRRKKK